ncbi:hypothetical protein GQ53DRAFT_163780 [Thozetella sp. PMI_491]|nr:hypothetical protein GQ53DRAFT_163780 [Thozetella sp. PMI_491]
MPLWKSGSTASRPKTGNAKSIRGTISGPIPIPNPLDDDEFPIRNPGTSIAATSPAPHDDEFPIRTRGAGIASPVPPETESEAPIDQPAAEPAEPATDPVSEQELEPDQEPESEPEPEVEPEYEPLQPPPADPSIAVIVPEISPDITPEALPEQPQEAPPLPPTDLTELPDPVARSSPPRASPPRGSPPRTAPIRQFALSSSPPKERAEEPASDLPLRSPRLRNSPPRAYVPAPAPAPGQRINPMNTYRYSTVSETPTGQTAQSKDRDTPARKKSTLRSTFSKLFGRKKKKSSGSPDNRASAHISELPTSSQHHSDPTALSRVKEGEPKRSASLPITEFDRPLRSHSIGPDDIIAIESARDSLQADSRPVRRRAATATTSRLYLQPRRDVEWGGGLSPRPASTQGRGSGVVLGEEHPDEIGRAITSDNDNANGHRRRSRSLSGLNDYVSGRAGVRRRSDEIRYWRESYDPGFMSPLSSNAQEDNDTTGGLDVDPESPLDARPPKTPPQPFNFGSISKDMVGMKITQAASIDTRIGSLEARTQKIERVVNQLCHSVPGFKSPLADSSARAGSSQLLIGNDQPGFAFTTAAPPMIPAIYQAKGTSRYSSSRHSVETDAHSQTSFGDAPTYIGSLHPPSSSATQSQSLTSTAPPAVSPLHRPTSTSTVRGAASLPTMGRDAGDGGPPTAEDHSSLVAQLEAERAARLALEAQVKKLSERLNALSTTMFAMIGGPAKSRSQERLAPPVPSEPVPKPPIPSSHGVKTLSVFETSDDEDNGKKLNVKSPQDDEKTDDESVPDDFQTPREDRYPPQIYGAFGEELRDDDVEDDDPKRKKAARTLSLSQLTLKKGVQAQV